MWLMHQEIVDTSTRRGADASLLDQQIEGRLELADSLRTSARVRLEATPSAEEAIIYLGRFVFVALHLFSAGGHHLSAVADLLNLIVRLEELHNEVQGMI